MKKLLSLMLAAALLLTACGGGSGTVAATMHLKRCEGTVGVSDDAGKDVEPIGNLDLYSGYGVDTRSESYAWIDLDNVKLTKLDQNSEIAITKEGKKLEIEVISGSLFFNVTQPLADDETMNIRTSTMIVGIRGTCGWAALSEDRSALTVGLLEGKVECSNGESTAAVSAGEKGTIPVSGEISVSPISAFSVPAFVKAEIEGSPTLAEEIEAASGFDPLASVDPMQRRDMFTYSRALHYNSSGELAAVTEFFPDEQGRIAKSVQKPAGEYNSMNDVVTTYEYNDAGTLATKITDRAGNNGTLLYYTVTEDTVDHRTRVTSRADGYSREVIDYYDAEGRLTRTEDYEWGELLFEYTYTYDYDEAGKVIRSDNSNGSYILYEYD